MKTQLTSLLEDESKKLNSYEASNPGTITKLVGFVNNGDIAGFNQLKEVILGSSRIKTKGK